MDSPKPVNCILVGLLCGAPLLPQSGEPILVDSGRGKLEMVISGSGSPAVVLEAGFADTYEYWAAVAERVSAKAKTVRYNRAGFGSSPLNDRPRTAQEIARELHGALANAGVAPPYVLVGHSAGGMYVRVFAHLFPLDTAGIVLVDSGPDSFYEILQLEDAVVWDALVEDLKKRAPAGAKAQLEVNAASVEQAKRSWPLPRVPLVSISATKPEPPVFSAERRKRITTLQREVLRRIAGAQHIEATGCGHNIPVECSEIVGDAVLHVLAVIRRQRHPERP